MSKNPLVSLCAIFLIIIPVILPSPASGECEFPALDNLRKRNVSIELVKFAFASGMRPNEQGKPNGNGIELLKQSTAGSGFIVKSDGTIVTNLHVATRAMAARAVFDDGSAYQIKHLRVYDPNLDLAILKILADREFPTATLGDSNSSQVMDKVIAVGNSLGMGFSVTEGSINQIMKTDEGLRYRMRHSAPIAPGNSGGALYRCGEVVGVNVATMLPYEIHYAIPINLAKPLLEYNQLLRFEEVFPTNLDKIVERYKTLHSLNGQVPAVQAGESCNSWAVQAELLPLRDYAIGVVSPEGTDLDLCIQDAEYRLIGYGGADGTNYEVVFLTSTAYQTVYISVMNYHNIPVNCGLYIHEIVW